MSDKLEKLDSSQVTDMDVEWNSIIPMTTMVRHFNNLIDRINELEARYEGHKHGYYLRGENPLGGAATTPPIKDDD